MLSHLSHAQLWDTMYYSASGSFAYRILQARILYRVAVPSSRGSSDPGIEPMSLKSPALAGGFFTINATWEALSQSLSSNICLDDSSYEISLPSLSKEQNLM